MDTKLSQKLVWTNKAVTLVCDSVNTMMLNDSAAATAATAAAAAAAATESCILGASFIIRGFGMLTTLA